MKATSYAKEHNIAIKAGNVLSADEFYTDDFDSYKKWAAFGLLCVEMEAAGLYTIAAKYDVRALAILTISDSLVSGKKTTADDRESSFSTMIHIALNTVI